MFTLRKHRIVRSLLALICLVLPVLTNAQSTIKQDTIFSYAIVEARSADTSLSQLVRNEILADAARGGGIIYATWVAADKPADAPFAGLAENQMGLMLAWNKDAQPQIEAFDAALQTTDELKVVSNRTFEAIYLPFGLSLPTAEGFYVHREEKYSLENESDAVRLSQEAWVTWEPRWQVTVVGLFRERGTAGFSNLNRIVWYPSYEHWLQTRSNDDAESQRRFRERRGLQMPGSGVAIATDRALP